MNTQATQDDNPAPVARAAIEDNILLPKEVEELVRLSRPTIYRLRREGKFPPPIQLTDKKIGWRRGEVDSWLRTRAVKPISSSDAA